MSSNTDNGGGVPPAMSMSGPPYMPQVALVGGRPTSSVDDPISAVLLLFFVAGAAFHMTVFQINLRRKHKFIMSVLLFGFCMARIAALVLRIVWASRPTNTSIALAANIFTAAGVVILFIVNLIFAQRLLRAYHPKFGWSLPARLAFRFSLFSVVAMLIMVVTVTVISFFTLNQNTRPIARDIQLFASTYLAFLAFMPLPVVLAAWAWPRMQPIEKFGTGRLRTKVRLVVFTATLLTLGAGFRVGTAFDSRPITQPAWFHHRAAYYCFNFVIEIIVVYSYGLLRFDTRFHIPNGSSMPGDYSGVTKRASFSDRINDEAEAFGTDGTDPSSQEQYTTAERASESAAQREQEKQRASQSV